jgi:chromate transporter
MEKPGLWRLTAVFMKIGNLTFGGDEPTVAALGRELVERRGWLSADAYGLGFGLARVTPGTNVLAFCAAAGWFLRGWPGAVLAVLAVCGPSAGLMWALVSGAQSIDSIPWARAAISGTAAAVVGMMAANAILLIRPQWRTGREFRAVSIALTAFAASTWLHWPPVPILIGAALTGYVWRESEVVE